MSASSPMAARRRKRSSPPLIRLALACVCLLVALLAVEYHVGATQEMRLSHRPSSDAPSGRVQAPPASVIDPDAVPDPARLQEWTGVALARPLFSPSRRPASVAVAGPQEPRLAGIVLSPSGRKAIFAGEGDARGVVVGAGGQAGGWHVQSIAADSVVVIGPSGLQTLHPTRDGTAHAADATPNQPSILDLLRSRPLNIGPPGLPSLHGAGGLSPSFMQAPPGQ